MSHMFAGTSLGRDSVISITPGAKGVGYDCFYILYLPNKATAVEEVFQVMADSSWNMVLLSHRIFRTYMFSKRQTTLYNVLDLQRQIYCRIYCVLHTYNMHIITCSPFDVYSKWLWCVLLPQLWNQHQKLLQLTFVMSANRHAMRPVQTLIKESQVFQIWPSSLLHP